MPDTALVELVDSLELTSFEGEAFRHIAPAYNPLQTDGARIRGGRWNPPESFPTLYLALDERTAAAELRRLAQRQSRRVEDLLPRTVYIFRVRLRDVLDLDLTNPESIDALALADAISADDMSRTQAVGEAAHYLSLEAILAPSATSAGRVLAVFFDRLRADSTVQPANSIRWTEPPDEE